MRKLLLISLVLVLTGAIAFAGGNREATIDPNATATGVKYYVAHQGAYIGEAVVTINALHEVISADFAEYMGPSDWVENPGDGAVVRVPDPLANLGSSDPAIRGYMFYIYNEVGEQGEFMWSQYSPGANGFSRPSRHWQRDFDGMMSNPIRAKAYADAVKADTLVTVYIDGVNVTVGPTASEVVANRYGTMNKADAENTYMPLRATSLGYRYNHARNVEFFINNPMADYAAARQERAAIALEEDLNIDANADVTAYGGEGNEWIVADARTGATWTDLPHYSIEMQEAYKKAVARMALGMLD